MTSLSKKQWLLAVGLTAAVLGIQLSSIARPYLGHFASYQGTVMAAISRNMLRENFSQILLPKTDLVIGGERSLHLNQYPFPSLIAALGTRYLGGTLEFWGRFQAVVFNFFTILLIALIAEQLFNIQVAWIAAAVYALSPFSLIYGQCFMSEAMALFFLLLAFHGMLKSGRMQLDVHAAAASGVAFSVALTGRIHFLAFYPIFFFHFLLCGHARRVLKIVSFTSTMLLLPCLWYGFAYFVSKSSSHVMTSVSLQSGYWKFLDGSFLKSAEYWKKILDLFSQNLLTPLLFPFLPLGWILMEKKGRTFWICLGGFLLGSAVTVLWPQKVWEQDFYLYGAFPFAVLLAAFGIHEVFERFPKLKTPGVLVFFLLLYLGISTRYFLHPIYKYPKEDSRIVPIGERVRKSTPAEARLIVAGNDPTSLFYYAGRPGWTLEFQEIGKSLLLFRDHAKRSRVNPRELEGLEAAMKDAVSWFNFLKGQGASYLVTANKKDLESQPLLLKHLQKNYQKLSKDSDDFYFFKL